MEREKIDPLDPQTVDPPEGQGQGGGGLEEDPPWCDPDEPLPMDPPEGQGGGGNTTLSDI